MQLCKILLHLTIMLTPILDKGPVELVVICFELLLANARPIVDFVHYDACDAFVVFEEALNMTWSTQ